MKSEGSLREETVTMLEALVAAKEEAQFPASVEDGGDGRRRWLLAEAEAELGQGSTLGRRGGGGAEEAAGAEADEAEEDSSELSQLWRCAREASLVAERLDSSRAALATLRERYAEVAGTTSSLHEACEQLMADQTRLAGVAEELRTRLAYFTRLGGIAHKLSASPAVGGSAFAALLNSIDEGIAFLAKEAEYKESGAYLSRYQQCLSRALSLVKQHVLASFHSAKEAVSAKLAQEDSSLAEDSFTLYYGLFASQAQATLNIMQMLEAKWDRSPEYAQAVSECYEAYFATRDALLAPSLKATVAEMSSRHGKSACTLMRAGCSFLLRLCEDEYRLFFQFFSRPSELLHDFLERECGYFYDAVRPLVIHIPHLENLAELASILKWEFLEERCAPDPDQYGGFMAMAEALLGDVGEKLVFRAHTYAASDIKGYSPAPGDLAYPEKLLMMQEIALSQSMAAAAVAEAGGEGEKEKEKEKEKLARRESTSSSAADLHGLWYPTVRRTVLTLSKLYRCLDLEVFQGLCQDVLAMCVESLRGAQQKMLLTKKPLDAQLFLVKHLLILREQTAPFRGNMSHKETSVDFSKLKDSAVALMGAGQRGRWLALNSNNALLELITQVPAHVSETRVDSRRVLDGQLREACQALIAIASANIIHELKDWLEKADVVRSMGREGQGGSPTKLSIQPFASPQALNSIVAQAWRKLKDGVPALKGSLALYIGSKETEAILFAPIRKALEAAFDQVLAILAQEYSPEEAKVVNAPSVQQLSLVLSQPPPPPPTSQPSQTKPQPNQPPPATAAPASSITETQPADASTV